MRKILLFLFLFISFIEKSQADDIKDFEIEGISIGDSLLDFFEKIEIKKTFFIKIKNTTLFQVKNINLKFTMAFSFMPKIMIRDTK